MWFARSCRGVSKNSRRLRLRVLASDFCVHADEPQTKSKGVAMTLLHSRPLRTKCVRLASAMRNAAGNVSRGSLILASLALAAMAALPSAPATAQTIYVGNSLNNPGGAFAADAVTSPPLVILGEYNPKVPS